MSEVVESSKSVSPLGYGRSRRRPHGGWTDWAGNSLLLALCLGVAVLSAGITFAVFLFDSDLVFFAGLFGQGAIVCMGLHLIYQRARLQNRAIMTVVAVLTGLLAVLLVHMGLWIREAWHMWQRFGAYGFGDMIQLAGVGFTTPYRILDVMLGIETGHKGLLGYLLFRMRDAEFSAIMGFHAMITTVAGVFLAIKWTPGPVCPRCSEWLGEGRNAAVVRGAEGASLADAITRGDVPQVLSIIRDSADAVLEGNCTIARLWKCDHCQTLLTDVRMKAMGGQPLQFLPITPTDETMAQALKSEPVVPVESASDEQTCHTEET